MFLLHAYNYYETIQMLFDTIIEVILAVIEYNISESQFKSPVWRLQSRGLLYLIAIKLYVLVYIFFN